ncbi:B3/4 domain-containing protein [Candidatus Xianfuyuplasma coldseepsis]|uniref:B3/B4 tRNA-binding domain-containing protein n=1 Tax=Candidatus Xianfuyuplasma coldseepsis TaxID=2782163 RepID=A0A7L7KT00_9MOLU|nr:phenylalanine--tRNA ligase beta subunit-related protein [Xianfuyuplasma coldseepsis]QMS85941.1 hypothetical protein G4Z02_09330 [Xianfuyuplasma coldseepsis]
MKITIDSSIQTKVPQFHVAVLIANVTVDSRSELNQIVHDYESSISSQYDISDVVNLPIIKEGRDAYKAFGKDPSRYRLAVESLYRRIVKGNALYRINNVVDLGNVLSLHTRKSVAVLDYHQIKGDVVIRLGTSNDEYYGIGRGKLNIEHIPLYEDEIGPFGSTTSDTDRTKITMKTSKILLFIISFTGTQSLQEELDFAADIYSKYADATIVEQRII